jgi:hypothetical protein
MSKKLLDRKSCVYRRAFTCFHHTIYVTSYGICSVSYCFLTFQFVLFLLGKEPCSTVMTISRRRIKLHCAQNALSNVSMCMRHFTSHVCCSCLRQHVTLIWRCCRCVTVLCKLRKRWLVDGVLCSYTLSENACFDVSEERVLSISRVTDFGAGEC